MTKWKVIFWLTAFITFLDFIGLPFQNSIHFIDLVGLFIGAMLLVPYYGYSYQVAVGSQRLWQVVFTVIVTLNLIVGLPLIYSEIVKIFSGDEIWLMRSILLIMGVSILVILAIPPFRYAFKSKNIWSDSA